MTDNTLRLTPQTFPQRFISWLKEFTVGKTNIQQSRMWLALGVILAFALVTTMGLKQHWAGDSGLADIRVVYIGASLLLVTLVLLFGVGSLSRYLPEPDAEDGAPDAAAQDNAAPAGAAPSQPEPAPSSNQPSNGRSEQNGPTH